MNSRWSLSNDNGGVRRTLAGAFAVDPVANFEVDRNLLRDAVPDDWAAGEDGAGLITAKRRSSPHPTTGNNCEQTANGAAVIFCDDVKNDSTTFAGGSKEENPAGWGSSTTTTPRRTSRLRGRQRAAWAEG